MISSIIQALFLIKDQTNMSEQEKKRQRNSNLLNVETKQKFLCLSYTKQESFGVFFLHKKCFLRKRKSGGLKKKTKDVWVFF